MEEIDFEKLRKDLFNYFEGAFFAGGFGAAMFDMENVKYASDEELIEIARKNGFRLEKYIKQKSYYK